MGWLQIFLICVLCAASEGQMTSAQWRADLDALAEGLLEKHPDFYTKHTVEEFEDTLAALDDRLSTLDDQQVVIELGRLAAMGGDSHTGVGLGVYRRRMRWLPIQMIVLSDGVFIPAASDPNAGLIGAELLAINGIPIGEVIDRVSVLFAWENRWKKINTAPAFATNLPSLAAVGVIDRFDAEGVEITIARAGEREELTIESFVPGGGEIAWTGFAESIEEPPVWISMRHGNYQSRFFAEHRVMYVAYNRCREAADLPMTEFIEFVLTKSDELDAGRLVIDLRSNGGGDETLMWAMIERLKESDRFNERGDVIVLTSRRTYSSATSNAAQFRQGVGAVLIGEPTGGKPNHFGRLGSFTLPNSGLRVSHSKSYMRKVEGDPDSVYPDIQIEMSSADFFGGRDPVLDAAISYQAD